MTARAPQRPRHGRVLVPAMKVGLPLLAHALLAAAALAEVVTPCDETGGWAERLTQGGAVVAAVAMLANAALYFPRDRWSFLGKRLCVALLFTGGVLLLVTYGHCALA